MPPPAAAKPAAHYHWLAESLRNLEADLRHGMAGSAFIPADWAAIAQADPEPAKVKVTLRVDADVARFFRTLGTGHLTRMNAVLRAFMHARLAGVVKGAEGVAYSPTLAEQVESEAEALGAAMLAWRGKIKEGTATKADDARIGRMLAGVEEKVARLGEEIGE